MKKLLLLLSVLFSTVIISYAQDFEGIVEFRTQEGKLQQNSVWYIKGNMVRVDEFETGTRVLKSAYLIDIKKNTVTYLDHKSKMWWNYTSSDTMIPKGCSFVDAKNSREFFDFRTSEHILHCPVDTLQYSFWTATSKFDFFLPAMRLMGPVNNYFSYFMALGEKDGSMPFLVEKKNMKGEVTGKMEATRVEKRLMNASLFAVPADYRQKL